MSREIADLKVRVDLATLIEQEIGPAPRKSGRWLFWRCPFHPDKTPSFGVTPDTGRFKCFGCGASGDHLDWLERRQGLGTAEAIRELQKLARLDEIRQPSQPVDEKADLLEPPSKAWQVAARGFVDYAEPLLWEKQGAPGLAYLRGGGLVDETIQHFGLGWNPRKLFRDADRWGLAGKSVCLERGVTIPCCMAGVLWTVKIRRFGADGQPKKKEDGRGKYGSPREGRGVLFGADDLLGDGRPLLLCEGERDAMLAWQELQGLVDVATLGGAGKRNLGRWLPWLLPYRCILVAYDNDRDGRNGAAELEALNQRMTAIRLPHSRDLTDFHSAGGDLRVWIGLELDRLGY